MICAALGRPVRVALLKGRANYLCRHRLDVAEQQAYTRGLKREVATALAEGARVVAHDAQRRHRRTAERSANRTPCGPG